MAIAYGAYTTGNNSGASSLTYSSPDVTGSDTIGFVAVFVQTNLTINTVTWNGSNCTFIGGQSNGAANNERIELWYIASPAAGVTNIVISRTGSTNALQGRSTFYTGAKQTGIPDASQVLRDETNNPITSQVTTVADGCWVIETGRNGFGAFTATSGITFRSTASSVILGDSNAAKTPAGVYQMQITAPSAGDNYTVMASFAPAEAPVTGTITQIVAVGGGGGGCRSTSAGGGGSGGDLRAYANLSVTDGESLTITVGAAGSPGDPATAGGFSRVVQGGSTILEAAGGGQGTTAAPGAQNGTSTTIAGSVSGGNGGAGATASGSTSSGGGGGAGGYSAAGGAGGFGATNGGSSTGGGGGGGRGGGSTTTAGAGGGVGLLGAGANGAGATVNSTRGDGGSGGTGGTVTSTGGTYGGGGGGDDNGTGGGPGGAGGVSIRYITADFGTCTGGTITTDGIYTIHTFTSDGTFTVDLAASTAAALTIPTLLLLNVG